MTEHKKYATLGAMRTALEERINCLIKAQNANMLLNPT